MAARPTIRIGRARGHRRIAQHPTPNPARVIDADTELGGS